MYYDAIVIGNTILRRVYLEMTLFSYLVFRLDREAHEAEEWSNGHLSIELTFTERNGR